MINIKNLNKYFNYGKVNQSHILKDINLSINENDFVLLKGVSGSGKSTLLSIIGGLLKPTSGTLEIKSKAIAKLPDEHISNFRLNNIGFVFQAFNLFEEFTSKENLMTSLIPTNNDYKKNKEQINTALKLLNIYHKKDEIISNLSGGEKQRVSIARAIVNNPDILLFDEPTSALDYDNSLVLCEILKDLKKSNKTIIVSTHDPIFEQLDFIDKKVLIKEGKCMIEQ